MALYAYVKPFVKRQKNDAADAEAVGEAAMPPTKPLRLRIFRANPALCGFVACLLVNMRRLRIISYHNIRRHTMHMCHHGLHTRNVSFPSNLSVTIQGQQHLD